MSQEAIKLTPFSRKQRQLLNWWTPASPVAQSTGIIASGSIRAGKSFPMAISFIEWAFFAFQMSQAFAICGKTVGSVKRNILFWLLPQLVARGFVVNHKRGDKEVVLTRGSRTHTFYYFGGRDESSQDLIQGLTLAGVLFDEVALMPESFVNQATGRCSVEGAKLWFNCNPDSPSHWFKTKWIDDVISKGMQFIHFTMEDNPSLSLATRMRYRSLYTGVFYQRFILGLWVMAEGAIYDMWTAENEYESLNPYVLSRSDQYVAIDYGTQNPMVFLWILDDGTKIWVEDEYYYDGRKEQAQKTDSQYADDLIKFMAGRNIRQVIIDPSAASFIAELKVRGIRVKEADNEVLDGIRLTATLIQLRILNVNKLNCPNFLREVGSYAWDTKLTDKGREQPLKKDDHAMDAIRYFNKTKFKPRRLGGH